MDTAEVAVMVGMQEDVSAKMPRVRGELASAGSAMRQLGSGVAHMGSMFLGMSIAMERSSNASVRSTGSVLAMVGGLAMAAGSAAQFITAASKIAKSLQQINIQLIIQKALSGPGGWLLLAGAGAAAGGAMYAMNQKGGGGESHPQQVNVRTTVVLDKRVVGETVRSEIISAQKRNANSSGVR